MDTIIPLDVVFGLAAILLFVWTVYWVDDKSKRKRLDKIVDEHVHPWKDIHKILKGNNSGGGWRNRTWKPNPGFNDEFAGKVNNTCGQIRPGEWQCNCIDKDAGCRVLIRLKAEGEPAEEITDRRGAIAAQKARKKNN